MCRINKIEWKEKNKLKYRWEECDVVEEHVGHGPEEQDAWRQE